mgnify:CR=1 FL=1
MNCCDLINKTKRKQAFTENEIKWLVNEYTNDNIPDYQISAWLMAVCLNSLSDDETLALTAPPYIAVLGLPVSSRLTQLGGTVCNT